MKIIAAKNILYTTAIFTAFLFGCSDQPGNSAATEEPDPNIIKKEVVLSPEAEVLLSRFPTPFELTLMLNDARAPYIFSLSDSPENLGRYFTEKTKSIALGIYTTDLAYAATYNMTSETGKYLYCTGKLAGDLGIAGVYDKRLVGKVNSQKNSKDSLVVLIKKVLGETNDFLGRNNRTQVAVRGASGAFAEGRDIAASLCQAARNNLQIASAIYRQKENLDKLLKILNEYGMDSSLKPVRDELEKLRPAFTDFGLIPGASLPPDKAAAIAKLAREVRDSLVK